MRNVGNCIQVMTKSKRSRGLELIGKSSKSFENILIELIESTKPSMIGIAVAYVSTYGFFKLKSILDEYSIKNVVLLTCTKDYVTEPEALSYALESKWSVRVLNPTEGIFHAKIYIGAQSTNVKSMKELSMLMVGSSNLSKNGMYINTECMYWTKSKKELQTYKEIWLKCIKRSTKLTTKELEQYITHYEEHNKDLSGEQKRRLGLQEALDSGENPDLKNAKVSWVGLETITGEYQFQLEFPRESGLALQRLFDKVSKDNVAQIFYEGEGSFEFTLRVYQNNQKRLGCKPSVPMVEWIRENKRGIMKIEYRASLHRLYYKVLTDEKEIAHLIKETEQLGNLDHTSTRKCGWI